ncbi:MAG: hypothetical protein RLZZ70_222 [Candidatus Parcubacteria bacterium]|jgi:hypothetical protein
MGIFCYNLKMTESIENTPYMNPEQLRAFMYTVLERADETTSEIITAIARELESMYSTDVLKRSAYWHAFAGSGIKEGSELLPNNVENGIGRVCCDLIDRKLKPEMRS